MKADGGALVYIVLAIVSIIVSAIGKNKRKGIPQVPMNPKPAEQEAKPVEPQATWQKELEDIFGKAFSEPEMVSESPKNETVHTLEKKEVLAEVPDAKVTEWNNYLQSKKTVVEEPGPFADVEIYTLEEEHSPLVSFGDFELSKAVVYAEVLNRKYF
jgi:hypothetical protein